ncbi:ferritin [Rothia aerolata]|uniref:Ferritin n=1 Tax=Rothia aerolata TaxID=1812262 RepID=A0A917J098_9MICC|nr:ferritin [Rothia aerolata]GGH67075.1 ferritin [Rothia aerolata]
MQITTDLEKKFQEQITLEFESAIAYRQLAIEADEQDLPGISAWFHAQAEEETQHALKFIKFVSDRGNHANIGQIPEHSIKPGLSPVEMFEVALANEQKVSAAIRDLYRETEAAADFESRPLLNWFMEEQIEEEATTSEILARLQMVNGEGSGLLRIDAELGGRQPAIAES